MTKETKIKWGIWKYLKIFIKYHYFVLINDKLFYLHLQLIYMANSLINCRDGLLYLQTFIIQFHCSKVSFINLFSLRNSKWILLFDIVKNVEQRKENRNIKQVKVFVAINILNFTYVSIRHQKPVVRRKINENTTVELLILWYYHCNR